MSFLVAEYLHKCRLSLSGQTERLEQISRLLGSQRVERTAVRREGEKHRLTGPRKKAEHHSLGELRESKTK